MPKKKLPDSSYPVPSLGSGIAIGPLLLRDLRVDLQRGSGPLAPTSIHKILLHGIPEDDQFRPLEMEFLAHSDLLVETARRILRELDPTPERENQARLVRIEAKLDQLLKK